MSLLTLVRDMDPVRAELEKFGDSCVHAAAGAGPPPVPGSGCYTESNPTDAYNRNAFKKMLYHIIFRGIIFGNLLFLC